MSKYLLAALLGLLAGLWCAVVLPFLPDVWAFSPLLPLIVLTLVGSKLSRALIIALIGAATLDLYRPLSGDWAVVRWLLITLLLYVMGKRLLSNRSVYAVVGLIVTGRILDVLSTQALASLLWWSVPARSAIVSMRLGATVFWDLILAIVGFIILAVFTGRLSTQVTDKRADVSWL
jgi:hypothetical protein